MSGIGRSCSSLACLTIAVASSWPWRAHAETAPVALPAITVESERTDLQDSGVVIRVPVAPLGAADLGELLASLPGVQIRSSGGLGSFSEASLRGSSGRQVRVLLDGLPLDAGGGEASSLSLVSPLLLEQVDVYKGRVPVDLGSGLAGTINLRSRRELAAPVVGSATLGSFGQRQLDVAGQLGDALQLAVGAQAADNDFHFVNSFGAFDPANPDRSQSERRQNAATEQTYGLLRYQGALNLSLHFVDDQQALPSRLNLPDTRSQFDTRSYSLTLASPPGASWQTALSHRFTREAFRDPASEIGLGAQQTRADTHRTLASVGKRIDQLQDSFSVEYTDYRAEDSIGSVPTAVAQRVAISNGLAAQTGDSRQYNASLQTSWSQDESDGGADRYWRFEPALGVSQILGHCVAAANLGHRRRLPTFFERYGDRGLFRGNPALRPERANYADLGARCASGESLQRLDLTLFGQDLHDAISPAYNAQGVGRSVNTDRGLIVGVEMDAGGKLAGFGWQLSATWQHTEDRSDVQASRGQQLPGRFTSQINSRIERSWRELRFHYAYRLEAGAYYDTANLLKAPEMQRHDVGVRGAIHQIGWSLQALNLLADRIEQFNGYPNPGRRVLLSLTYPSTDLPRPATKPRAAANTSGTASEPNDDVRSKPSPDSPIDLRSNR